MPGLERRAAGKTFRYFDAHGREITDGESLARIRALAIPPAWKNVWICPMPNGHLQATGVDARGRKQYRYHRRWHEVRDENKYSRMIAFGKALPNIRTHTRRDIRLGGLGRKKVLAAIVRLLELSLIRVGNEEYAKQNRSFGLTTLQDRHARVRGDSIQFRFRGKSGIEHDVSIHHPRVARIVRTCQELPGQDLFQYLDDEGARRDVTSEDVNAYLREITGRDFTAKDFRAWTGTVLAALALQEFEKVDTQAQARKNIVRAIERVAERLGNTPSVCRKCYVHPTVLEAYFDGEIIGHLRQQADAQMRSQAARLRPEEAAVLGMLQRRLAAETASRDLKGSLEKSLWQQKQIKVLRSRPVRFGARSVRPRASRRKAASSR